MSDERWVKCHLSDDYEVSDQGRVRRASPGIGTWVGRIMAQSISKKDGYPQVVLFLDKKPSKHPVHRLVAQAFYGRCPSGMVVCHNDGSRTNNVLSNLRIDTISSNYWDTDKHNTRSKGSRHGMSRLSEEQVAYIRATIGEIPARTLAVRYGVTPDAIHNVRRGRSWKQA